MKLGCFLVLATSACLAGETARPADTFMYLPPRIADRVVFYHSFEKGLQQAEINSIGAKISAVELPPAKGLTGNGCQTGSIAGGKKGSFRLQSPALGVSKPLTVMFWWRLDEPMKEETSFNVVMVSGNKGYISNFVHGKGEWCALKEPTYCFQVWNFPGIENHNDVWGGRVWIEPRAWHHAAMTLSGACEIRLHWDGRLRTLHAPKGRAFHEGETGAIELGSGGQQPAMTLDEVIVLDRALSTEEIQAYVLAVQRLAERGAEWNRR